MKLKFSLVIFLLFILVGCEKELAPNLQDFDVKSGESATNNSNAEVKSDVAKGVVTDVTDGDTIKVEISEDFSIRETTLKKNQIINVRLLLIDTPESVGAKAGMALGKEASDFTKQLLEGKEVEVEFDEGDIYDKYDRTLAYIYLNGKRVQNILIENGFAMIRYIFEPNTKYLDELRLVEEEARKQQKGIWSIPNYVTQEEGYNLVGITNEGNTDSISNQVETIVVEEGEKLTKQLVEDALKSLSDLVLTKD